MLPSRDRRRRGAAVVEFAFVLPVFLLFLLGLLEISRAMIVISGLNNVARVGCRTGVMPFKSNSDVENVVKDKAASFALPAPTMTITVNGASKDVSTAQARDQVKVVLTLAYADVSW